MQEIRLHLDPASGAPAHPLAREAPCTALGELLKRALLGKSEALGRRYTYQDLARDSGVGATFANKVAHGVRLTNRAVLEAWARALRPFFPLDEALRAAGFTPPSRSQLLDARRSTIASRSACVASRRPRARNCSTPWRG